LDIHSHLTRSKVLLMAAFKGPHFLLAEGASTMKWNDLTSQTQFLKVSHFPIVVKVSLELFEDKKVKGKQKSYRICYQSEVKLINTEMQYFYLDRTLI